jgi:hypothetical protein
MILEGTTREESTIAVDRSGRYQTPWRMITHRRGVHVGPACMDEKIAISGLV